MGKPSSTSLSRCSECSLHPHKQRSKVAISTHKMEQIRKKKHYHVQKNISKVFNKLKRDSIGSRSCLSLSETSSDDTPRNLTIIVTNDSFLPERKRKSPVTVSAISDVPSKVRRKNNSLIVINDDDVETNNDSCILLSPRRDSNSHVNCSTPIAKRDSQTLKNHIISNFYPVPTLNEISPPEEPKEDDKTKIINKDSYVTIDLTADSENRTADNVNVIDVDKCPDKSDSQDCTVVSVSNASLSMSGDSDVTVIRNKRIGNNNQAKKLARGLAQMNTSQKEKLLNLLAQQIFSGCDLKNSAQSGLTLSKENRGTETDEDAYIKEVILGETKSKEAKICLSRNSIGSNVYHPRNDAKNTTGLRMIVIDGSNVAMEHTQGRQFSVEGLKICIDYFVRRGHSVKAFVPRFRCKFGKSSDPNLLNYMERQGLVVYTPSREIKGKNCVPYDDRYILQCAAEFDGVVVSGDNYRDLINENKRWRYIIENRVLPFTWVNNMIMFPKDPFGRAGPTLEMLLRHPTPTTTQNTTSLFNSNTFFDQL